MVNAWVEHVRAWSKANGVSYMCAVSKPECSAAYRSAPKKLRVKMPMPEEINARQMGPISPLAETSITNFRRKAARRAKKPTVRMGKTVKVPKSKLNAMVGMDSSMIKE